MSKDRILVGIDLGTSSVKVLAIDGNGRVRAQVRQGYNMYRPFPGWVQQSPVEWWNAVKQALGMLGGQIDLSHTVGVGLSGQLNGLVMVDKAGNPLTDVPIWLDQRATEQSMFLAENWANTIQDIALGAPDQFIHLATTLVQRQ